MYKRLDNVSDWFWLTVLVAVALGWISTGCNSHDLLGNEYPVANYTVYNDGSITCLYADWGPDYDEDLDAIVCRWKCAWHNEDRLHLSSVAYRWQPVFPWDVPTMETANYGCN